MVDWRCLSEWWQQGNFRRNVGIVPSPLRERVRERVMKQVTKARALRKRSSDAERLLWSRLRNRRLFGLKFRRQEPIGEYIVDFVCREQNLIIELDGGHHQEQIAPDLRRTAWLNSRGFRVVRYWNNDVLRDLDSVLESIRLALESQPSPSP